jgi:hypothetical protein
MIARSLGLQLLSLAIFHSPLSTKLLSTNPHTHSVLAPLAMKNNPSLHEEPRRRRASPIPVGPNASMLDWLHSTGRLIARDDNDGEALPSERDEEIADMLVGEDTYDSSDDDDSNLDSDD